ncbi:MAG: aminotransferase class IV [Phycisphaeraceae bacterium]
MNAMLDDQTYVYLNGSYLPKHKAALSVEDRGTLFGDGVYEVVRYYGGRPLAIEAHVDRLRASLRGIALDAPADVAQLPAISDELVQRNNMADAKVYWQITRGPAPRDHALPAQPQPSVLVMSYPAAPVDAQRDCPGWRAITAEDRRWQDCWIKSLMLLPNVLARHAAQAAGAHEAILHRDGTVTEGSSTNAMIVRNDTLRTHPADRHILGGVTRRLVLDLAQQLGYTVREEAFTLDELRAADEVLLTGTTTHVAAVTHIDDQPIGAAAPGPVARALHEAFVRHVQTQCGAARP